MGRSRLELDTHQTQKNTKAEPHEGQLPAASNGHSEACKFEVSIFMGVGSPRVNTLVRYVAAHFSSAG